MKAVLLDFDGTIVDSQPIINEFLDRLFEKKKVIITDTERKAIAGISIRDLKEWLWINKQTELHEEDVTLTDDHYLEQIELFPGSKATLALLKARGYKLALVSNSPRKYVDFLFHKYGLFDYFDATYSEDEALVPKPNPYMLELACKQLKIKHDNTVIVDDSPTGILAGNAIGITSIRIGKTKEDAQYVISNVTALPTLLERIHFTPQ